MILLIDNYDSFSYNLYQYLGALDPDIKVIRNDEMTAEEIMDIRPSHIIISPGPGRPSDAGVCEDVVRKAAGKIPVLGVCLGHQAIFEAFGGRITYAKKLMHGKQSISDIDTGSTLFKGLPGQIKVARYHSLAADEESLPDCLKITGRVAEKLTKEERSGKDGSATEDGAFDASRLQNSPDTDSSEEDRGDIMAIEHRDYPVFGVQFHPESILTPDGMTILKNFLSIS